ncbi:MAG: hypothetical protein EOO89_00260 [Pedobacter sp.]|nr:MAG: hypothetical protein EOO89_00260 [Pedobacter sp.]
MEIHYIWLPEFKNIQGQGFNFSSKYIFDLTETDKFQFKISVKINPAYIPDFFEKDNIINVTAIVGQNGAGKSNILDYIKLSFPEGKNGLHVPSVVAVSYLKNGIEEKYIYVPNNFEVTGDELNDFKITSYHDLSINEAVHERNFYENTYIYYSNIFDTKIEEVEFSGIRNISTTSLLRQERDDEATQYLKTLPTLEDGNIDGSRFTIRKDSYDIYLDNELRRNIQFLLSPERNLIKFPLPEKLYLSLLETDLRYIRQDKDSNINSIYQKFLSSKLEHEKADPKRYFLARVYLGAFLNIIVKDKNFTSPSSLLPTISDLSEDIGLIDFVRSFFEKLPDVKYSDQTHGDINIPFLKTLADATLKFFDLVEQMLNMNELKVEGIQSIFSEPTYSVYYEIPRTLPASEEGAISLFRLLTLYMNVKGFSDFLSFTWRSLSSGEQSMFSLLSRFHHLKAHDYGKENIKPNLVILIDEGDIYYHPNWQKEFFEKTIEFLSTIYDQHTLQIILTTNTPFLSSDLPKSNIIFIEKNISDSSISVLNADNSKEDTFAGNIHMLFADAFYMQGALMGTFAKRKVQAIIDYIAMKEKTAKHENYRKTITIIGEPILKRKLSDMWIEAFGDNDELVLLEERIAEIKSKQK